MVARFARYSVLPAPLPSARCTWKPGASSAFSPAWSLCSSSAKKWVTSGSAAVVGFASRGAGRADPEPRAFAATASTATQASAASPAASASGRRVQRDAETAAGEAGGRPRRVGRGGDGRTAGRREQSTADEQRPVAATRCLAQEAAGGHRGAEDGRAQAADGGPCVEPVLEKD